MVTYIIDNVEYLDFATIKEEFDIVRSHTWKVLLDNKIDKVLYRNRFLYHKDQSVELLRMRKLNNFLKSKSSVEDFLSLVSDNKRELLGRQEAIKNYDTVVSDIIDNLKGMEDYTTYDYEKLSDLVLEAKYLQGLLRN